MPIIVACMLGLPLLLMNLAKQKGLPQYPHVSNYFWYGSAWLVLNIHFCFSDANLTPSRRQVLSHVLVSIFALLSCMCACWNRSHVELMRNDPFAP